MELDYSSDTDLYLGIQENSKVFNPIRVTKDDIKRAKMVALEVMKMYKRKDIDRTKEITFNNMLVSSLANLYNIGIDSVIGEATSIIKDLEYREMNLVRISSFVTNSMVVDTGCGFAKEAVSIFVPSTLTEASSVFMSHEVMHILKERNPEECRNINTLSEMIPMLIELIVAFNSDTKKLKEIIYERLTLLDYEAINFISIMKRLQSTDENKKRALIAHLYSSVAYLNSFYYTLAMFSLYIKDSDYVLCMLNDSVSGNLSTQDIIRNVFDYEDCKTEYSNGLSMVVRAF